MLEHFWQGIIIIQLAFTGLDRMMTGIVKPDIEKQTFLTYVLWFTLANHAIAYMKKFIEKYGYPLCIKKWTSFFASRVLVWKQSGLFPELGSVAPYPWLKVDLNIRYDEGDYYSK